LCAATGGGVKKKKKKVKWSLLGDALARFTFSFSAEGGLPGTNARTHPSRARASGPQAVVCVPNPDRT